MMLKKLGILALGGALAFGCDDSGSDADQADAAVAPIGTLTLATAPPASAPSGQPLPLSIEGPSGTTMTLTVELGGGAVDSEQLTIGPDGTVDLGWTLGIAPVKNRLSISATGLESVTIELMAELDAPLSTELFGDVGGWLAEQGIMGSTEDLAFAGDTVVLGVPEGLVELDPSGALTPLALTGDTMALPLGMAYDAEGTLWIADPEGAALHSVTADGVVTTRITTNGTDDLDKPNYVAIAPDGKIWLTDPCLGQIIVFNPQTDTVDAVHQFDRDTEGGPNGIAFDAAGAKAWVATENVALLCSQNERELTDPIAGVFTLDAADPEAAHETVAANVGLFGDGLAFDAEGNLYVIFDQQENFALTESVVWVLPAGGSTLVRFLSAKPSQLYANVAFGSAAFGATTLYITLLNVAPFTELDISRGVDRIDIGIAGQPLLP